MSNICPRCSQITLTLDKEAEITCPICLVPFNTGVEDTGTDELD